MKTDRLGAIFACLALLFCGTIRRTYADELATLTGRVTDSQGLVVPAVKIEATNINTNVVYSGETNGDGLYRISGIPPGLYRVIVQKPNFAEIVKPAVEVHVQDDIALNFTMRLGSVSERVTVDSGAPLVNTESGAVSTVIDRQFVENLPVNGRTFNTLLQLTPGAVIAPQTASGELGQFSINGQRTDANYFIVDGVGANFGTSTYGGGQQGGGVAPAFNAVGGTSSLVSVDAMQEFRIQTSSFAPEYGHLPGGQIAIETRSGTNEFHGRGFDYFRNTVLDANDWFSNAAGKPRAPENQNDFGGVLGGPLLIPGLQNSHDKTFFFFSYEGLRLRQPQTQVTTVPTMLVRSSAIAAAAPYLNAFPKPDPNAPDLGNGTAQFTASWPNRIETDAISVRIDHHIASNWSVFGRFNDSPSQIASRLGGLGSNPSETDLTDVNTRTITIGLNGTLTRNIVNSLRVNYSRQSASGTASLDSFGGAIPPASPLLLPSPLTLSSGAAFFDIFDTGSYADGFAGRTKSTQFDVLDDFGVSRGAHRLKFGLDERALWVNKAGTAGLDYFASTAQNLASSATADLGISSGVFPSSRILSHFFSLYGQDTWKIGRRLTLTYGLRWELDPSPSALGSTIVPSWESVNDPAATALAPVGTPAWKTTYGNVAPRVGFAYSVTRAADFVVRGGIGSYYDTGSGTNGYILGGFGASVFDVTSSDLTLPRPNLNGLTPIPSIQPPYQGNTFYAISPDLQLPRSYQWNISMEKSLGGQQSVSATYLGQVGRRLLRSQVYPIPTSNSNFLPGSFFILANNGDTSDYNALQLQYKRPLSRRLQALANYTWGHSIDTNSSDVAFNGSDQIVPAGANRGSSSFDVRQNVTGAFTYELPSIAHPVPINAVTKEWSLSLVAEARTGFPIDVRTSQLSVLGFQGTSRPDLVSGQPFWLSDPNVPGGKRLNRAAFVKPSTPRQGDLARNSIQGFGMKQFDLSGARQFAFSERWKLQFRGEIFNLANHPNFANPLANLASRRFGLASQMLNQGLGGLNALYQVGGPRSVQLSLKLLF